MLASIAAIFLGLASGATDFPPESIAQLTNGARIFKPPDMISARIELPQIFERMAIRMNDDQPMKLLDVFVTEEVLALWRNANEPMGWLGTNALFVWQCAAELPAAPAERQRTMSELARGMLSFARENRRAAASADKPVTDVPFGPSVRDDHIIMVSKRRYDWRDRSGQYLLSNLVFWPEGRCLSLMLNSEGDSPDAVRTLLRMTELLAEKTLDLTRTELP